MLIPGWKREEVLFFKEEPKTFARWGLSEANGEKSFCFFFFRKRRAFSRASGLTLHSRR